MATGSSQAPREKKAGRPISDIKKEHFRLVEVDSNTKKWHCKYCGAQYSEKTASGNFTRHMKNCHKDKLKVEQSNSNLENMGYTGSPESPNQYSEQGSVSTTTSPDTEKSPCSNVTSPLYPMPTGSGSSLPVDAMGAAPRVSRVAPVFPSAQTFTVTHPENMVPEPQLYHQSLQNLQYVQQYHMVSPYNSGANPVAGVPVATGLGTDLEFAAAAEQELPSWLNDWPGAPTNNPVWTHCPQTSLPLVQIPETWLNELPEISVYDFNQRPSSENQSTLVVPSSESTAQEVASVENLQPVSEALLMAISYDPELQAHDSETLVDVARTQVTGHPMEVDATNSYLSDDHQLSSADASLQDEPRGSAGQTMKYGRGPRGTKRKGLVDDDWDTEDLSSLVHTLKEANWSDTAIQDKIIALSLTNPVYLNAFLNDNMHLFCNLAHCRFPMTRLSVRAVNYELIGRKQDGIRAILQKHCDRQWAPLLFDVFVFPLQLQGKTYALVELVFPSNNGGRQTCLLDYKVIPDNYPVENLAEFVSDKLREFGVDRVLSNVCTWGERFSDCQERLQKYLGCDKPRQRNLAFAEETKKNAYFRLQKRSYEEQAEHIYLAGTTALSMLEEIERKLDKYLLEHEVAKVRDQYTSLQIERHLRREFQKLDAKFQKLKNTKNALSRKITKIIKDTKQNAIYYTHKNTNPVNLLHVVSFEEYGAALKDVYGHLERLAALLDNPVASPFDMSDLTEELQLTEVEEDQEQATRTPIEMHQLPGRFPVWKKTLNKCTHPVDNYIGLCKFMNTKNVKEPSTVSSRYAEDFQSVAQSAPDDLPEEIWRKIVLLRSWGRFESDCDQ